MMGSIFGLALVLAAAAAKPSAIVPLDQPATAELQHAGDHRPYVVYDGSALGFRVPEPATIEIAARAVLKKGAKRGRLHLVVKVDRQVVVDQSQVLAIDPRATIPLNRLTRPLVSFADVTTGAATLSVEVRAEESSVTAIYVAVSAISGESADAPLPEVGTAAVLPDLVAPQPPTVAAPSTPPPPQPAPVAVTAAAVASSQPAAPPYQPSRYVGVDLQALFGPGIPGVELAARYYAPLLDERLSAGLRAGYRYTSISALAGSGMASSSIDLALHLIPLVAFVEGDALRLATPAGRLSLGGRIDAGALIYTGGVSVLTQLAGGELAQNKKPLLGATWCAGGAFTGSLEPGFGALVLDLGYLYAPDAVASSGADQRYRVQTRVLGPRAALGYRIIF